MDAITSDDQSLGGIGSTRAIRYSELRVGRSTTVMTRSGAVPGAPSRDAPTVDADHLPGHVAGVVAHEEGARRGDVLGAPDPAHRCRLLMERNSWTQEAPLLGVAEARRIDEARRDRVDRD